mgnify:CR=1 FL=1
MSQPRYRPCPEYENSGVDWLGEIPAHWETRRLKYAAAINTDTLPDNTDPDFGLQYVDIGNVDSTGSILDAQEIPFERAPSRARRQLRHGDTIISTTCPIGFSGIDRLSQLLFALCQACLRITAIVIHRAQILQRRVRPLVVVEMAPTGHGLQRPIVVTQRFFVEAFLAMKPFT